MSEKEKEGEREREMNKECCHVLVIVRPILLGHEPNHSIIDHAVGKVEIEETTTVGNNVLQSLILQAHKNR